MCAGCHIDYDKKKDKAFLKRRFVETKSWIGCDSRGYKHVGNALCLGKKLRKTKMQASYHFAALRIPSNVNLINSCVLSLMDFSFQVTLALDEQNRTHWQSWHPDNNTGHNEMDGLHTEKKFVRKKYLPYWQKICQWKTSSAKNIRS